MKKEEIVDIIKILKNTYPDARCSLDFTNSFELVVAVMLSAQCTDERVNKTTPSIFKKYHNVYDFANADLEELEVLVHPCGFFKNKAKNIKACAQKIISDFNGEVPHTMDKLLTLPGIGRKSANVILLEVFGIATGIAVDTHAKRLSNRIGLTTSSDPITIEQDLLKIIPTEYLKDVNHLFMWLGRNACTARNPNCEACSIQRYCKKNI